MQSMQFTYEIVKQIEAEFSVGTSALDKAGTYAFRREIVCIAY